MMLYLSSDPHGLMEVGSTDWQDHELLHGQFVSSMAASIDDIKGLPEENKNMRNKALTVLTQWSNTSSPLAKLAHSYMVTLKRQFFLPLP